MSAADGRSRCWGGKVWHVRSREGTWIWLESTEKVGESADIHCSVIGLIEQVEQQDEIRNAFTNDGHEGYDYC